MSVSDPGFIGSAGVPASTEDAAPIRGEVSADGASPPGPGRPLGGTGSLDDTGDPASTDVPPTGETPTRGWLVPSIPPSGEPSESDHRCTAGPSGLGGGPPSAWPKGPSTEGTHGPSVELDARPGAGPSAELDARPGPELSTGPGIRLSIGRCTEPAIRSLTVLADPSPAVDKSAGPPSAPPATVGTVCPSPPPIITSSGPVTRSGVAAGSDGSVPDATSDSTTGSCRGCDKAGDGAETKDRCTAARPERSAGECISDVDVSEITDLAPESLAVQVLADGIDAPSR